MKKSFLLGEPDSILVDIQRLIDTRLLIQANSGGGKSWCLRRILEQTHGAVQHLVIDPEGEFSSLRERFDYVLAAKSGGDTAADVRSARLLAERLLELGVSAILDIYELKAHERVSFVKEFLDALVNAPKKLWHPALIVVDEAHVFCPEEGKAESAGAVIDLATRGRKRGFCAVLATQRLAKLHKDAAAECNNKLIGRTGLDVDLKRAVAELGFGKDRWRDLQQLPEGSFFAYGPAISRGVVCVQVGGILTSHPKAGARLAFAAPPPTDKVRALLPRLADLPAESEQRKRTEEEMRREISTLKRELAAKPKPAEVKPERVEVPVLGNEELASLKHCVSALNADVKLVTEVLADVAAAIAKVGRNGHQERRPLGLKTIPPELKEAHRVVNQRPSSRRYVTDLGRDDEKLSGPEQRILDALAWLDSIAPGEHEQAAVAFLAGYTVGGGAFNNPRGALRGKRLIVYCPGDRLALSEAGRARANVPEEALTPEELQARVLERLPGPESKILRVLLEHYPDSVSNEELARAAGYEPGGGAFNNPRGRLRSLGLIGYRQGHVVALPVLFLERG